MGEHVFRDGRWDAMCDAYVLDCYFCDARVAVGREEVVDVDDALAKRVADAGECKARKEGGEHG